jgi:segregation and condensation protein A
MAVNFSVSVDMFDGPLDLLLHLVKLNELPIEQISLGQVAEQFLDCVNEAQRIEVEIAGEYLVIAATLLSIKARYILQAPVDDVLIVDDGDLIEDPHEALLLRLRELAVYKEGAEHLADLPILGCDIFAVPALKGLNVNAFNGANAFNLGGSPLAEHNAMDLGRVLRLLAKKKGIGVMPLTFEVDPVSVTERMESILHILRTKKDQESLVRVAFTDLVDCLFDKTGLDIHTDPDTITRRLAGVVIGCFLAILELCRHFAVRVEQDEAFSDLMITLYAAEINLVDQGMVYANQ